MRSNSTAGSRSLGGIPEAIQGGDISKEDSNLILKPTYFCHFYINRGCNWSSSI